MKSSMKADSCILVIFGASGDLTQRKLIPALYNLCLKGWMPDRYAILGMDRVGMSDDEFRDHLRQGMERFSPQGKPDPETWTRFAAHLSFITAELDNLDACKCMEERLTSLEQDWRVAVNRIFYLAVPPAMIGVIAGRLDEAGLARDKEHARIVVEKPFGHDLDSARALNKILTQIFIESQIFRIDHYLGKETVQNILAFRFANSLFDPFWNRRFIDHVQITVAEQIGIGHRGAYYDHAGALRDMVQNHLSQVLCLIAMEPPVSFAADEIRNKKVDVLQAIRPIPQDQIHFFAVRGQYGSGWIKGERVKAYCQEQDVTPDSATETFTAIKYFIDNWRWQDVPFYLRTGKRLSTRISEITVQFRPVPHQSFPASAIGDWKPNRLTIRIQPNEGILLRFQAKQPGLSMRLVPVEMRFSYQDSFHVPPPEAYETLLLDVMLGDTTQFMRADQVEIAWSLITPILHAWEAVQPDNFPNYPAGTWGPEEAIALIARDGHTWIHPTIQDEEAVQDCEP
jgi:glucose-6-phosphate 1-dehydrogenase